jgi:hypothetical protein
MLYYYYYEGGFQMSTNSEKFAVVWGNTLEGSSMVSHVERFSNSKAHDYAEARVRELITSNAGIFAMSFTGENSFDGNGDASPVLFMFDTVEIEL